MTPGDSPAPQAVFTVRRHPGQLEADPRLVAQGWEPRFITDGARSREVADLYRQLGFDVRLEPVLPGEVPEGCTDCQLLVLFQFKTVYTRKDTAA